MNDVFISYGRKESKVFATKLWEKFKEAGLDVWFDQNDIPLAVDFQEKIDDGIEKAHNFIFIIAPHSITSEYCLKEVELAVKLHKRIIPVLHIEPTDKELAAKMHPVISKLNWVFFREKYEPEKPLEEWIQIDRFEKSYNDLLNLLTENKQHITKHTEILVKALDWNRNKRTPDKLLASEEQREAKEWMKTIIHKDDPPCKLTDLQCEFITESEKYVNNMMTDAFFSYAREDIEMRDKIRQFLTRNGFTTWADTSDIKIGVKFAEAINKGIEQADNVLFLISEHSVVSKYCLDELKHAIANNKRIIPLLIENIADEKIPDFVRQLQYIEFHESGLFDNASGLLYNAIIENREYHRIHKELLVKALDWEEHDFLQTFLLHSTDLHNAETWLKSAEKNKTHGPTDIMRRFITESRSSRIRCYFSCHSESENLVKQLKSGLENKGYDIWVDLEDMSQDKKLSDENYRHIEKADNVIFVSTPASLSSPACNTEVEYAVKLKKRIIPLIHIEAENSSGKIAAVINNLPWVYFREGKDDFDKAFRHVTEIIESHTNYVKRHTGLLMKALAWDKQSRPESLLLSGEDLQRAEGWLNERFDKNPPCQPTDIHAELICESRKANENGWSDVFFCYARDDYEILQAVRMKFMHHGISSWVDTTDIRTGTEFEDAIHKGIEEADNFVFLISPKSIASEYCIKELKYMRRFNKRVIPVMVKSTHDEDVPDDIRKLQYHNIETTEGAVFEKEMLKIIQLIEKDREYFYLHKKFLVHALEWEKQNQAPTSLLHGFDLENASDWLENNRKRKENPPVGIQRRYIQASLTSRISIFISYGRKHSKHFASQLYQKLNDDGYNVWFDQNDIPLGVDFQEQIDAGIENCDNFIFIISPHSVKSVYCLKEILLAEKHHKRIIPILHIEPTDCWDKMHPLIEKLNWIFFQQKEDFNKPLSEWEWVSDFDESYTGLTKLLKEHSDYVKKHTLFLNSALNWQRNRKDPSQLLIGSERQEAEKWLVKKFKKIQPPAIPTDLHAEYICESKKNANNRMTDVFVSYAREDIEIRETFQRELNKKAYTIWTDIRDISKGGQFEDAIKEGITQADSFLFLISPNSIKSKYCLSEIEYALSLNKRIIPLLIIDTNIDEIPKEISSIQFIEFTEVEFDKGTIFEQAVEQEKDIAKEKQTGTLATRREKTEFEKQFDELLKVLETEKEYYHKHKLFLAKAVKWEKQKRNQSILLRGYNLQNAEAWLKIALTKTVHSAIPLQEEFITESRANETDITTEVFISYSRANSDFARRLNDDLQTYGKTTWFDQESIASGTDFATEINKGIENSDNFIFVITPKSIKSPYCAAEVEHAKKYNKRIVTLYLEEIDLEDLHPVLAAVQWINFEPDKVEYHAAFSEVLRTLDSDREHVQSHTKWMQRAKEWDENDRTADRLLRGDEFSLAATWLDEAVEQNKTPKVTPLHQEFIDESRKGILLEERRKQRRRQFKTFALIFMLIMSGVAVWYAIQASIQEGIANRKRKEAEEMKMIALAERDTAEIERDRAEKQKEIAEFQRAVADTARRKAESAERRAIRERNFALLQQAIAERERDTAQMARDTAEVKRQEAIAARNETQREKDRAIFHLYEFNAKAFANKAITIPEAEETQEIKALLALTALELKETARKQQKPGEYSVEYEPEILGAMQEALFQYEDDKLFEAEAWAMQSAGNSFFFGGREGTAYITKLYKSGNSMLPVFKEDYELTLEEDEFVNAISPSGNKNIVFYATSKGKIYRCNTKTGENKLLSDHNKQGIMNMYFANSDNILVTIDNGNSLLFTDADNGSLKHEVKLNAPVTSFIQPGGDNIMAVSNGNIVAIDVNNPEKPFQQFKNQQNYDYYTLAYSDYFKWTVAGTSRGKLLVLQTDPQRGTVEKIIPFPMQHEGVVNCMVFSPDNQWLATGSHDGTIMLWYLKEVITKGIDKMAPLVIHNNRRKILSLTFDENSKYLIFSDFKDVHIRPLEVNEAYKMLRKKVKDKTMTNDEWDYYRRGELDKPEPLNF